MAVDKNNNDNIRKITPEKVNSVIFPDGDKHANKTINPVDIIKPNKPIKVFFFVNFNI